jgi:hypothetical protein
MTIDRIQRLLLCSFFLLGSGCVYLRSRVTDRDYKAVDKSDGLSRHELKAIARHHLVSKVDPNCLQETRGYLINRPTLYGKPKYKEYLVRFEVSPFLLRPFSFFVAVDQDSGSARCLEEHMVK